MRIAGAGWGRCIWFVEAVWVSPVPRYQSRTNSEGSVIPSIYLGKFHHDRTLFSRAESWLREIIPIHGSSMQVCEILVHLPRYYPDITQIYVQYETPRNHSCHGEDFHVKPRIPIPWPRCRVYGGRPRITQPGRKKHLTHRWPLFGGKNTIIFQT